MLVVVTVDVAEIDVDFEVLIEARTLDSKSGSALSARTSCTWYLSFEFSSRRALVRLVRV